MAELIEFTVKARGKYKPKQINIPLKKIEEYKIQADEQFKVTLERIAAPTIATQTEAQPQAQPETTPAA